MTKIPILIFTIVQADFLASFYEYQSTL